MNEFLFDRSPHILLEVFPHRFGSANTFLVETFVTMQWQCRATNNVQNTRPNWGSFVRVADNAQSINRR
jgi:hypothetical protein